MRELHEVIALLEQWEHRNLVRRELWVQSENDALLIAHHLFAIGVNEEGKRGTVGASRRLNNPRREGLLRCRIKVREALATLRRMT